MLVVSLPGPLRRQGGIRDVNILLITIRSFIKIKKAKCNEGSTLVEKRASSSKLGAGFIRKFIVYLRWRRPSS